MAVVLRHTLFHPDLFSLKHEEHQRDQGRCVYGCQCSEFRREADPRAEWEGVEADVECEY